MVKTVEKKPKHVNIVLQKCQTANVLRKAPANVLRKAPANVLRKASANLQWDVIIEKDDLCTLDQHIYYEYPCYHIIDHIEQRFPSIFKNLFVFSHLCFLFLFSV